MPSPVGVYHRHEGSCARKRKEVSGFNDEHTPNGYKRIVHDLTGRTCRHTPCIEEQDPGDKLIIVDYRYAEHNPLEEARR